LDAAPIPYAPKIDRLGYSCSRYAASISFGLFALLLQVLDLFVVFGKPFALRKSFIITGGVVAALQGGFMGFACLAFFNFFDFFSRRYCFRLLRCKRPSQLDFVVRIEPWTQIFSNVFLRLLINTIE
jgi:hypothetical protein